MFLFFVCFFAFFGCTLSQKKTVPLTSYTRPRAHAHGFIIIFPSLRCKLGGTATSKVTNSLAIIMFPLQVMMEKFIVEVDPEVKLESLKPGTKVALKHGNLTLHKAFPAQVRGAAIAHYASVEEIIFVRLTVCPLFRLSVGPSVRLSVLPHTHIHTHSHTRTHTNTHIHTESQTHALTHTHKHTHARARGHSDTQTE